MLNRPSVPDRTAFLLGRPDAPSFVPALVDMARDLEALGCTVLAMPCNTAHARVEEVRERLARARIVDMPRETAAFLHDLGCTNVGVLATDGTLAARVYQDALAEEGLAVVVPPDESQREVMGIIYDGVKAGRPVPQEDVLGMLDAVAAAGCDGVVLGCTEARCCQRLHGIAALPWSTLSTCSRGAACRNAAPRPATCARATSDAPAAGLAPSGACVV